MHRRLVLILVALAALAVISIATFRQVFKGKRNQTLSGIYVTGFEHSDFYPNATRCPPSGTRYWLVPETIPTLRPPGAPSPRHTAAYISFVGDLSPVGSYGHLGQYRREVEVTKILEVKNADGCP